MSDATSKPQSGGLLEWLIPLAFIFCAGWVVWHLPAFFLDLIPPENESLYGQIKAIHERNDVIACTEVAAIVEGHDSGQIQLCLPVTGIADVFDWFALLMMPVLVFFGIKTVRRAPMEFDKWRTIDKFSVFIGRVTMMMALCMTLVMLYEVLLRYVFERPTLWANELTLWLAGFVFLLSGLYAMQQRCHIRIFLLYDVVPRSVQKVFDTISTLLICVFAFMLVFGSYKQVFVNKLYKWELYGSAFNPPIPATLQPMVLIAITLVAIQAVINLISDWNDEPVMHTDEVDAEEIEAIKKTLGG